MANGVHTTKAGEAIVSNLVSGLGGTVPKNIGWGTGTTTPTTSDTALQTEAAPTTGGGRTVGTCTRTTTTDTNDTLTVTGVVTAGSTLAITEVGLFDNVSAGNMLLHAVFSAINVVSGNTITFTINVQFQAS